MTAAIRLGPLGGLREVPLVQRGVSVQASRSESSFVTLGGRRAIQRSARAARDWAMSLGQWRTSADVAYLTACADGSIPGPLYLHTQDAALSNLLSSDVAAPCRMGTVALGSVVGAVPVGMAGGAVPMSGVVQQATAGAWSATVPIRQVSHVLSAWASAAGAAVEWRTVTAAGVQVATGTVAAATVTGGFYGAVTLTPGATAAGMQVRLSSGSRTVGGLRLVEGVLPDSGPVVATNLATNPSFEAASSTVEVRRNLCTNPSFEVDLNAWSGGSAATRARFASSSTFVGSYVMRVTRNSATPGNCFAAYSATLPVGTYTWSFYTRIITGAPTYQTLISASGGAVVTGGGGQTVAFAGSTWVRATHTFTVTTAGTVSLAFRDDGSPLVEVGQAVDLDAVLIEQTSSLGAYFDGATSPDSDLTASWTGTENTSPSILTGVGVAGAPSTGGLHALSSQQWASHGTRSMRLAPRGAGNAYVDLGGGVGGMRYGMVAGRTYTILATYRIAAPQAGTLDSLARRVVVYHRAGSTGPYAALSSPAEMSPNVAGVHGIRYTVTLPEGTTEAWPRLFNGASLGNGDVWWDDLAIIEGVYTGPWFDGSNAPAEHVTAWTGAPNTSTSVLRVTPEGAVWPGWAPGVGVPQVVVGDPQQTLQLATATEVRSDYTVTIREVG